MILIKTEEQIKALREGGKILREIHLMLGDYLKEGVSTWEIDQYARQLIEKHKVKPSFLGYHGFPAVLCTSLNEVVVHGIPNKNDILKNGDILKIDCGVFQKGVHSDSCHSWLIGDVSPELRQLSETVKKSMMNGIKQAIPGNRVGDIENAVQTTLQNAGYCPIWDCTGHGVGANLHEDPQISNYGKKGNGPLIKEGMCFAIEPMATLGNSKYTENINGDGWTLVAKDRAICAQREHSVLITKKGFEILT